MTLAPGATLQIAEFQVLVKLGPFCKVYRNRAEQLLYVLLALARDQTFRYTFLNKVV